MKTVLELMLAALLLAGCAGAWTRVSGECEGMNLAPDSGNSPCPDQVQMR